jgi:hypothetical protein
MEEFYIDIELTRGTSRIQVQEITAEHWDLLYTPQFVIEYYADKGFITFTICLEEGIWVDRNTRISENEYYLRYFELGEDAWNPDYQSPLSHSELQELGNAIARHMVVQLSAYMSLFCHHFAYQP